MSDCMPCSPDEKAKPTSRVCVSKEEAMKMKVDSEVSMHMTGKVISLQPSYDDKSMYEVTIEEPKVEVKSEDKKEDDNYATMPREKLKEEVKKKTDEESK